MPTYENNLKGDASMKEVIQQPTTPITSCSVHIPQNGFQETSRWHVSLALPIDSHASPTMVFPNKMTNFYSAAAFANPASINTLPSFVTQHHHENKTNLSNENMVNSDSVSQSQINLQHWYKTSNIQNGTYNNTNVTAKDQTEATTSSASSHLKNSVLASSSSSSAPNTSGDTVSSNSNKSTNRSRKRKSNSSKFKYTLQDHLNGIVKYKCDKCDYCTNRSDHFKRHLLVHSEVKPFKCCRCGYCTGRSDHFRRHLTRHGFTAEEIRQQYLLNGIKTSNNNHEITNIHTKQPTMVPQSNLPIGAIQNISQPINNKLNQSNTSTLKRHTCEQCGYSTNRHSHFVRHSRTHSNERPFECQYCGKKFKLDDYRKKHRCPGSLAARASSALSGQQKSKAKTVNKTQQNKDAVKLQNLPFEKSSVSCTLETSPMERLAPASKDKPSMTLNKNVQQTTQQMQQLPFQLHCPTPSTMAMHQIAGGTFDPTSAISISHPAFQVNIADPMMHGSQRPAFSSMCPACGMWFQRTVDYQSHMCPCALSNLQ